MADKQTLGVKIRTTAIVLVGLFLLIIGFQNTEAVDITVLSGTLSLPLAVLVALIFLSGALAGARMSRVWLRRELERHANANS